MGFGKHDGKGQNSAGKGVGRPKGKGSTNANPPAELGKSGGGKDSPKGSPKGKGKGKGKGPWSSPNIFSLLARSPAFRNWNS